MSPNTIFNIIQTDDVCTPSVSIILELTKSLTKGVLGVFCNFSAGPKKTHSFYTLTNAVE